MSWGLGILKSLLAGLRTVSGSFPDARRGAIDYPMADVTMAAFSMFFMQSESFLRYQKRLAGLAPIFETKG